MSLWRSPTRRGVPNRRKSFFDTLTEKHDFYSVLIVKLKTFNYENGIYLDGCHRCGRPHSLRYVRKKGPQDFGLRRNLTNPLYNMRKSVSKAEQELLAHLGGSLSHYDYADKVAAAGAVNMSPADKLRMAKIPGNPAFVAQFDVQILLKYFSVAAGVYTGVTAAALLVAEPSLATRLPGFVFGQSDLAGGFKASQGQFAPSVWAYDVPFVYGRDFPNTEYGELDATAKAQLEIGDLVIPFYASPGATDYVAFVIIRCQNVAYSTLLDAISSDLFWLNNIRYKVANTAAGLAQFDNQIIIQNQSLFGKYSKDTVSPNAFKQPTQYQPDLIDIPINKGIDKNVILGSWFNYDSVSQQWSIFVKQLDKLVA